MRVYCQFLAAIYENLYVELMSTCSTKNKIFAGVTSHINQSFPHQFPELTDQKQFCSVTIFYKQALVAGLMTDQFSKAVHGSVSVCNAARLWHPPHLNHWLQQQSGLEEHQETIQQILPALPKDVTIAVSQGEHGLDTLMHLGVGSQLVVQRNRALKG